MSGKPVISVLMTVFNREAFVTEAVSTVLASDYADFELIIVDDCSADASWEIITGLAGKDSRIRAYKNDRNMGDYPNRNKAAGYAVGKYIKYVDADDTIYPWTLGVLVEFMEKNPRAAYGLDSMEPDVREPFPMLLGPSEAYHRHYFIAPVFHRAPTSCIIRKDVFDLTGGFPEARTVSDFEYWHILSRKEQVLLMPQGMIWSRQHAGQESQLVRDNSVELFRYSIVGLRAIEHPDCPLEKNSRLQIIKRIKRAQARSIWRSLVLEFNYDDFREKKKMCGLGLLQSFLFACKKYA